MGGGILIFCGLLEAKFVGKLVGKTVGRILKLSPRLYQPERYFLFPAKQSFTFELEFQHFVAH